ncbi:hypothetical protein Lery_1265 [Legionella erythra]|uniref:Uncharacterized protein n=2 Tax=Legionella erythra TaxID=448 RepID=A0A0W0TR91_LEGER|nr:hypothetical protein [Legionella erythra]KTC98211.1 hypothetical protein Lery_1265 [Legionella erythra]
MNYLITRFIDLGEYIKRSNEGFKITNLLFDYVKTHGNTLKAEHITKLVLRGDSFSLTGINILGCLYDNYSEHVLTLKLIEKFKFSPSLHYYCSIRERYIDQPSPSWMSPDNDLIVGNLTLDLKSSDYLSKWANRGDSAFLSYLKEV